jgi:hypothetical protein
MTTIDFVTSQRKGGCVKIALDEAGVDISGIEIPDWCTIEDMQRICAELELDLIAEPCKIRVCGGSVILSVDDGLGTAHAYFTKGSEVPSEIYWMIPIDYQWIEIRRYENLPV